MTIICKIPKKAPRLSFIKDGTAAKMSAKRSPELLLAKNMLKLSPSDFAYLYEECKLCFFLKVKHGIFQPSMPMPGVFSAINTRLQTPLIGKNLQSLNKNLPDALVESQEGWVQSIPIPNTKVYIKGKYDLLLKKPDGTYILVDLKISQSVEDKIEKYKTQLGAYRYALENPASGKAISVSSMGLLIFYPDTVKFNQKTVSIDFPPTWFEIPFALDHFLSLMQDIDDLLSGPTPPEGKNCAWCKYRHQGDSLAHLINDAHLF